MEETHIKHCKYSFESFHWLTNWFTPNASEMWGLFFFFLLKEKWHVTSNRMTLYFDDEFPLLSKTITRWPTLRSTRCCLAPVGKEIIRVRNNCALFLPTSCLWCSLGCGVPGVHAVYDPEPVHGLDSEPQQEVSDQTSAVGADSSLHGSGCQRSHHSGILEHWILLVRFLFL